MITVVTGSDVEDILGDYMFPENNKHPVRQFLFAEKLVKNHNRDIIVVTYSPVMVEAIDTWSEYCEVETKYICNNIEIAPNELYKLYNNLGQAYDYINMLHLRIHREQTYQSDNSCSCCNCGDEDD